MNILFSLKKSIVLKVYDTFLYILLGDPNTGLIPVKVLCILISVVEGPALSSRKCNNVPVIPPKRDQGTPPGFKLV